MVFCYKNEIKTAGVLLPDALLNSFEHPASLPCSVTWSTNINYDTLFYNVTKCLLVMCVFIYIYIYSYTPNDLYSNALDTTQTLKDYESN